MSGKKLAKFINDYLLTLTAVPLIVGIHYGWWKLQQNPDLVDPNHNHELPLISIYKKFTNKIMGVSSNELVIIPRAEEKDSFEK